MTELEITCVHGFSESVRNSAASLYDDTFGVKFLVQFRTYDEAINELKDQCKTRPIVPFLGAGISRALTAAKDVLWMAELVAATYRVIISRWRNCNSAAGSEESPI